MSPDPNSINPVDISTPPPPNRFFQKWSREFSLLTGYGIPHDERVNEIGRRNCEKWKKEFLNYSPSVVFMLRQLKLAGVDVKSENLPCSPCDQTRTDHLEHTMVHELVHMFDHVKFKVRWNDLRHHACSEIRAASLSGECKWTREVDRRILNFSKQHQACVRRRAITAVMANEACPDKTAAERAVNEVWESCFNDTRPFDEIY